VVDTDAIFAPESVFSETNIAPQLVDHDDEVHTGALITIALAAGLVIESDIIYAPRVAENDLQPAFVDADDVVYSAFVGLGAEPPVTLPPSAALAGQRDSAVTLRGVRPGAVALRGTRPSVSLRGSNE